MNQKYLLVCISLLLIGTGVFVGSGLVVGSNLSGWLPLILVFIVFLSFTHLDVILSVLVLSMLLSPEIVMGHVPGRDIVVRIEDFLVIFLMLISIANAALRKDRAFLFKTPLNKTIIVYIAIFVLFTGRGIILAGVSPLKGAFYVLKYLEYYVIYFLAANLIRRKGQVKLLLFVFLLTFAIVNVYALLQIPMNVRVSAPFEGGGEPNTLGGYQVLLLGVILGLFFHVRSLMVKTILAGLVFLSVPSFLYTLSRSAYFAIIPMYLTFFFVDKTKRVIILGGVLFALLVGIFFLPPEVVERVLYTFEPQYQQNVKTAEVLGVELGPSASARIQSWRQVLSEWKNQAFFGYGVTGKGFLDGQYMRTLVELGAVGLLAFVYLLWMISKNALYIYRTSKDNVYKGLAIGFFAGHIGLLFHAITANTYIIIRIMEPYWFLAGMVMILPRLESNELIAEGFEEQSNDDSEHEFDDFIDGDSDTHGAKGGVTDDTFE